MTLFRASLTGNPIHPREMVGMAATIVCALIFLACSAIAGDEATLSAEHTTFFQNEIEPILKRRCYACHSHESGKAKGGLVLDSRSGWETGGSEGAAIVPGKPNESLIMAAVRHEDYEMPPDERLPDNEIALLEKWITMGAPDPRQSKAKAIDRGKLWALQPISKTAPPTVMSADWVHDDIDAFILKKLEANGLRPADDADRYTLLRRVTYDLTGLPPTLDEIEAFVSDNSDQAFENVVDRLLESPSFGDHWARHWFDLSCYADLADIQGNMLIRDAWRYRDYVIAALNSDKPLDRFIREQIAGDLLPYATVAERREQLIATGYLAIGPWTLQNYIKQQLDADVVDHQIDRIGRTFLAQTISCARCHDHKFDPVPTSDYYALAGIFHSTLTTSYDGPGVWSVINHVELPRAERTANEKARDEQEVAELRKRGKAIQSELTAHLLKLPGSSTANVLTLEKTLAVNTHGVPYEFSFKAGPSVWAAASQRTTSVDGLQIDLLREDGTALAEFLYQPGAWSGKKNAQQLKAAQFKYIGDGSGPIRIRVTSSTPGTSRFGGAIDEIRITTATKTLFAEDFSTLQRGPIVAAQADTELSVLAQAVVPGWNGRGVNHSHAVDLGDGNFAIQFFGGSITGLANAKPVTTAQRETHAAAVALDEQLKAIESKLAKAEQHNTPERALGVRDIEEPTDGPIYRRGDFQNLGDIVPRGFLSAVNTSKRYEIPQGTSGRLQLAEWLVDPENSLTSRVLVNRIWHHVFGKGLVRTVDYFGVHGELPSHPELLDFLADRMRVDDKWSLKRTVRRMVLSRTYRMASTHNAQARQMDPDNRWLWQMPRRRLAAEAIRDSMLAASGQLNLQRGGPSLGLDLKGNINGLGGKVNPPTWAGKISDDVRNRRSVYLPLRRGRPNNELEILSVFDFPHTNDIVGARAHTTVATQALFLLNAPFVKEQADKLAQRLKTEAPSDENARVNRLYLLATSRPATRNDRTSAIGFLDDCVRLGENRDAAWTQLCHAVLSSNSFLYRE